MTRPRITLDRATASQLNPLISPVSAQDTLEGLALLAYDLGHLISAKEQMPDVICTGQVYQMMGTIAAALDYEAHNQGLLNRQTPILKAI